jgi:hypothetical protein
MVNVEASVFGSLDERAEGLFFLSNSCPVLGTPKKVPQIQFHFTMTRSLINKAIMNLMEFVRTDQFLKQTRPCGFSW